MASAELSRHVEKVVAYAPLSERTAAQRREFQEALLDANAFEDLAGKRHQGEDAARAVLRMAELRRELESLSQGWDFHP